MYFRLPSVSTATPTYHQNSAKLDFESLDLTYYFIPDSEGEQQVFNNVLSLDRGELHGLTSLHLLEALKADLGSSVVADVNIIMKSVDINVMDDGSSILTETVIGNVAFSSPKAAVRVNELNRAVRNAFEGNGMDLYTFRLQIAEDPSLAKIAFVILGDASSSEVGAPTNPGSPSGVAGNRGEDDGKLNVSMIAIAAAVAASFLALLGLAIVAYWYNYRQRDPDRDHRKHPNIIKNRSMATRPTYEEDEPADDKGGNRQDGGVDDEYGENESVGTSIYSYLQDDNSISVSVAPSLLYSIHESDSPSKIFTDTPSPKGAKKSGPGNGKYASNSVLWSVMDTLSHHFHDPSEKEVNNSMGKNMVNTSLSPEKILGDIESESGASSSVLYDNDDKSLISDLGGGIANLTSPVKRDFESLWRDSEVGENEKILSPSSTKKQSPREVRTARKSNTTKALRAAKISSWSFSSDHSASSEATPVKTNNSMDRSLRSFEEDKHRRQTAKSGLPLPKALIIGNGGSMQTEGDSTTATKTLSTPKTASKRSTFVPSGIEGSAAKVASVRTKRISSKEWSKSPDNSNRSAGSETRLRSLLSSVKKAAETSTHSSRSHGEEAPFDDEPSKLLFDVDETLMDEPSNLLFDVDQTLIDEPTSVPQEKGTGSGSVGRGGGANDSRYISESDINESNLEYLPQDASIISGEKYDSVNSPNTTPPTVDKFGNIWRDGTKVEESLEKDVLESSTIKASTLIKSFDNVWNSKKSPSPREKSVEVSVAESEATERLNSMLDEDQAQAAGDVESSVNDTTVTSYLLEEKSFDIPGAEDRLPFEDENLPDTSILSEASQVEVEIPKMSSSNKLGGKPPRTPRSQTDQHLDEKKEDADAENSVTSPGERSSAEVSVDVNANYKGVSVTMASF